MTKVAILTIYTPTICEQANGILDFPILKPNGLLGSSVSGKNLRVTNVN
jgi:hypothetical protein